VFPYLVGMGVISYLGGFGKGGIIGGVGPFKSVLTGGHGHLGLYYDLLVLTLFSIAIYYLALSKRLKPAQVDQYVREVYPPPVGD